MIEKEEINRKAKEFEISHTDVERDYVFSWILYGIYTTSSLKDILILKGGNCLRKAYFENTRFSSDLDFSTNRSISKDILLTELSGVCDLITEKTGIQFEKSRNKVEEKQWADSENTSVHEAKIYFKDFYGRSKAIVISVRLDITQFDQIYLPIQRRELIHPYSDSPDCRVELPCVKLEEILATKLKCLLQRQHSNDFYDYAHSIICNKSIELNKLEILTTFLNITIFGKSPGFARKLFIQLPFDLIKIFWLKFIIVPKLSLITFEDAVSKFIEHIYDLFNDYGDGYGEMFFYPPEYRNIIMQAARSMTLLRVNYTGKTRLVEPYSLVYKVRKDQVGREYFYVWDRTGGSSGPGLKAFLHHNIDTIENTEEEFAPRYEVELCKSGEFSHNSYFGKSFNKNLYRPIRPQGRGNF